MAGARGQLLVQLYGFLKGCWLDKLFSTGRCCLKVSSEWGYKRFACYSVSMMFHVFQFRMKLCVWEIERLSAWSHCFQTIRNNNITILHSSSQTDFMVTVKCVFFSSNLGSIRADRCLSSASSSFFLMLLPSFLAAQINELLYMMYDGVEALSQPAGS